jgi:hypothetical protein
VTTLDPTSTAARATYNYLHTTGQITATYDAAGDVKVEGFNYWNASDPDASAQNSKLYAYGLVHYCLQYATYYGTTWQVTAPADQSSAITKLLGLMSTSTTILSGIAGQIDAMFSFKKPKAT